MEWSTKPRYARIVECHGPTHRYICSSGCLLNCVMVALAMTQTVKSVYSAEYEEVFEFELGGDNLAAPGELVVKVSSPRPADCCLLKVDVVVVTTHLLTILGLGFRLEHGWRSRFCWRTSRRGKQNAPDIFCKRPDRNANRHHARREASHRQ
jgi:hypothetical protein